MCVYLQSLKTRSVCHSWVSATFAAHMLSLWFFYKNKRKKPWKTSRTKRKKNIDRTATDSLKEANEKVGMEDEFGDGWNSISEECDCTDCNGTRSTGRCFRSEVGAPIARYCIFFFYHSPFPLLYSFHSLVVGN